MSFIKIGDVQAIAATPSESQIENAKANVKSTHPRLERMEGFGEKKDRPIAIVGGGPSLKRHLRRLYKFDGPIMACGSVNDYLMENCITPYYAVMCDPDPISLQYYRCLSYVTTYLLGTNITPDMIKYFDTKVPKIALWHCHSPDFEGREKEIETPYIGFNGGATVGTRALNIAFCMGYSDFHLFGFDSSLEANSHHAYEFATKEEQVGKVHSVKVGKDEAQGEAFMCEGYHIAQAASFKLFCEAVGHLIKITFHGEGLLPAYFEVIKQMGHMGAI